MQLTAIQTVLIWNLLHELLEINDESPAFSGWAKRACYVYLQKEITVWNSLSEKEKEAVKDTKLEFPVTPLPVDQLPPHVPDDAYEMLAAFQIGRASYR